MSSLSEHVGVAEIMNIHNQVNLFHQSCPCIIKRGFCIQDLLSLHLTSLSEHVGVAEINEYS